MKSGFSLIECMIYITCLIFFSLGLATLFNNICTYNKKLTTTLDTYAQLFTLQEKIAQLITNKPLIAWKKTSDHEIMWSTTVKDFGLESKKNKLLFYEGHFMETSQKWQSRKKTIITDNIDLFFSDITKTGLRYRVTKNKYALEQYVSLRNG